VLVGGCTSAAVAFGGDHAPALRFVAIFVSAAG
jgi:hypothetical protein